MKKYVVLGILGGIFLIGINLSPSSMTNQVTTLFEEKEDSVPFKKQEESVLEEREEEPVFLLSISNWNQSIPIGQAKDNSYYLTHTLTGKKDPVGTPFLDYRNQLEDKKLLIYGHNSKTISTPFHFLENYLDFSFFKNHSLMTLESKEKVSTYQLFSVMIVTEDLEHMKLVFQEGEYERHLEWLKKNSKIETDLSLFPSDSILILQTCYYNPEDSYLLVIGKKID